MNFPIRKNLPKLLFALFALVALVALSHELLLRDAKKRWLEMQRDARARGLYLTIQELAPKPVTDEQNFAMLPIFAEGNKTFWVVADRSKFPNSLMQQLDLPAKASREFESGGVAGALEFFRNSGMEVQGEDASALVRAMEASAPILNIVGEGLRERPRCVFPIQWEKAFRAGTPSFLFFRLASQTFALRARALLLAGRPEEATRDVESIFLLANALEETPTIVAQMVRMAIYRVGIDTVRFAQNNHSLRDVDLGRLRGIVQSIDFTPEYRKSLLMEQAMFVSVLGEMVPGKSKMSDIFATDRGEKGWAAKWHKIQVFITPRRRFIYENLNSYCGIMGRLISSAPQSSIYHPEDVNDGEKALEKGLAESSWKFALAGLALPSFTRSHFHCAVMMDWLRIADSVIGLELAFLKEGRYPILPSELPAGFRYVCQEGGQHFQIVPIKPLDLPEISQPKWDG